MTKAKRKVYVRLSFLSRTKLTSSPQPDGYYDLTTMLIGGSAYTIIMLNRWAVVTARTNLIMRGHAEPVRQGGRTCSRFRLHRGPNLPHPHHPCALHSSVRAHLLAVPTANLTLSLLVVPPFASSPPFAPWLLVFAFHWHPGLSCVRYSRIYGAVGLGRPFAPVTSRLVSRSVPCLSPFRLQSISLSYHLCYSYNVQACIGGITLASTMAQTRASLLGYPLQCKPAVLEGNLTPSGASRWMHTMRRMLVFRHVVS